MSNATGLGPREGMVVGQDGLLYGTAMWGGAHNAGTVFRLDIRTQLLSVLHDFGTNAADGATPVGRLWPNADGSFFGVTASGGSDSGGMVYRLSAAGVFSVVHLFGQTGPLGPRAPYAGVMQASDGKLYGTTVAGGSANAGTLYRLNADGSGFEVLHEFNPARGDSSFPVAELIEGQDGHLYGTSYAGGTASPSFPTGMGTLFRWRKSGRYEVLQALDPVLGMYPSGPLMLASDGALYGSNATGGPNTDPNRWGDVFRLSTKGRRAKYSVVMVTGDIPRDSASLASGLTETPDGYLWGTAYWGGNCVERGTVYRTSKSGDKRVIHSFCNADGGNPESELVLAADGWLYGTTGQAGGPDFGGTIFRIWPHDK